MPLDLARPIGPLTSTVLPLTDTQNDESPSFAPNGRLLVYATRVQGRDVLIGWEHDHS